jgi:type I restriction enzyme S subunit
VKWVTQKFEEAVISRGSGAKGLPQSQWEKDGQYPVIGQGAEEIEGWSNRVDLLITPKPAVVLYGGHTCRAKFVDRPFIPGPNVKILQPSNQLDAKFLFHFLAQLPVRDRGYADHFPEVRRCTLPLPPLEEQKRIAAVLDKAYALRRQREESLQLIEKLLQSVFIDMFGDPVRNSKNLPTVELGKFGNVQTGNTPPRSNKANYAKTGLEWIKTDNIVEDMVMVAPALERLSVLGAKGARIAPAGSLLVACIAGSEKSIGRAALTDREVAFNQQINAITPHSDTSSLFLYFLIKIARRQVQMAASKDMKKLINKSTFEGLRFIAPSYDDQLSFERVAKSLLDQGEVLQTQLGHLGEFLFSLQQRAFRGELDLSRLRLDAEAEPAAVTPPEPATVESRYKRPGCFIAPPEIEAQMVELENKLNYGTGDFLPWSEDYFKYRILSQILKPPFSFDDIWNVADLDFEKLSYDTVKEKVFEYVATGILQQKFDETRKEIVFYPRP